MTNLKDKKINQENQLELNVPNTYNKNIDSLNKTLNILHSILNVLPPEYLRELFITTSATICLIGIFSLTILDYKEAKSQFFNISNLIIGAYVGTKIKIEEKTK